MFIYHIYVNAYCIIVKMLVALYLQKNVLHNLLMILGFEVGN
jgi:hypothetical protein